MPSSAKDYIQRIEPIAKTPQRCPSKFYGKNNLALRAPSYFQATRYTLPT